MVLTVSDMAFDERDLSQETLRLVLLGTGTPNAETDRAGAAVGVVAGGEGLLVDAGPGVVRRAMAAFERGSEPLHPARIRRAFVTHLHSDHTLGLPDLIFTPWTLGRGEPLSLYGPRGLRAMVDHTMAAWREDIRQRVEGLEPAVGTGPLVEVHEIETPGAIYRDDDRDVTVEAFAVNHGAWPAWGYKIVSSGRSVVISGDTAPCESIREASCGCDVLLHEVYSAEGLERRPPDWRAYHTAVHTSSHELARIASEARPGLLVLYHQLLWGVTEEELVAEVRAAYDGPVVSGRDLDEY